MRVSVVLFGDLVVRSRYLMPPIQHASVSDQILSSLHQNSDNIAVIDGVSGAATTRGQLADQIERAAGWMKGNLNKGDVVGLSLPNIPQFLVPALGCIHAGGVVSLLNPIYTQSELKHSLDIIKPKVVITSPVSLETFKSVDHSAQEIVLVGADLPGYTPFTDLFKADKLEVGFEPDSFDDTAIMPLSSGTTGLPKVIQLSHKNCVTYNTVTCHPMFGTLAPGKNLLSLLPMFHMYGFTMALNCILKGAAFTTLPRFELGTLLKAVQEHKITHLPIVPPIAAVLAKHPMVDEFNISSVEQVLCAAAPLSVQLQNSLSERLKVPSIRNGWGMSELVGAATVPPPDASPDLMRKGSIGYVMPGLEMCVVDIETRDLLGPNQEGELLTRGDTVMKGYLGDPGATSATVDAEGWIHTGDIGKYDEEERFYITNRLKELIKYKGWQIAPAELEDVLLTHPAVADVGVVGVEAAEDGDGEVPRAFIVLKPGSQLTQQDVAQFMEGKLASYKNLRGGIVFIDALPRSLAGKLLRRELKKM